MKVYPILFFTILFLSSCDLLKKKEDKATEESLGKPLVKVHDKYLYYEDIEALQGKNISKEDSAFIIDQYIESWVLKQLLLARAESKVNENDPEIAKRINECRTTLVIHEYEEAYLNQKLDTTFTDKELREYYDANRENFELSQNIFKGLYVKVPKDAPKLDKLRDQLNSTKTRSNRELRSYCVRFANQYSIEDTIWTNFDELVKNTPYMEISDKASFLEKTRSSEQTDSRFIYFLKIKDYKVSKQISPYEFVEDRIKNILLNKRRIKLINDLKANIYSEAKKIMNLRLLVKNRIALVLVLLISTFSSNAQVIDKIIAKVDNQIVLKSEFDQALLQFKQQEQLNYASDDEIQCSVLETLVINKLLLAKAEIDSVVVDKETVNGELDRRMDYMVAQAGGDPKKIEQYFNKSLDQLKADLRKSIKEQLIIQKMQEKISGKTKVTPGEVAKFFSEIPKDSLPYFSTEVEVGQIVKTPQITRQQKLLTKVKAEEIRKRVLAGEDFCMLAKQYSEDAGSAQQCGEIGFFKKGELVAAYEAAALGLKNGETSQVTESEYGYHVIQMIERRGNEFNTRHVLIKPESGSESLQDTYKFLDSLKRVIIKDSATFEKAAHKYSDDKETQGNGGLFHDKENGGSRIPLENLDPAIFFIIDTMQVGHISAPLPYKTIDDKESYRIVYYKTKIAPHRANLKDDYQKINKAALAEKKNNAVNEWFDKNKSEVFIDIDPQYKNCDILISQ